MMNVLMPNGGRMQTCVQKWVKIAFTFLYMQMVLFGMSSPTADYRDRVRTACDLQMMLNFDGKERDAAQWADLLTQV